MVDGGRASGRQSRLKSSGPWSASFEISAFSRDSPRLGSQPHLVPARRASKLLIHKIMIHACWRRGALSMNAAEEQDPAPHASLARHTSPWRNEASRPGEEQ